MKNKINLSVTSCNILCALLMLIMIITQFLPFWELNGDKVSISGYIWLPEEHSDFTLYFQGLVGSDFKVDSIVMCSILQLLVPALGLILTLICRESIFPSICCAIGGLGGIYAYLFRPVYRYGSGWSVFLFVSVIALVAALYSVYVFARRKIFET